MATIEVDFEVYKQLTMRRKTEEITYNDVIRELLRLPSRAAHPERAHPSSDRSAWIVKGVRFPVGTEFRANYKGKNHLGKVEQGALSVDGLAFNTPSSAAMKITKFPVNGWRFWECRFPDSSDWILIDRLRT